MKECVCMCCTWFINGLGGGEKGKEEEEGGEGEEGEEGEEGKEGKEGEEGREEEGRKCVCVPHLQSFKFTLFQVFCQLFPGALKHAANRSDTHNIT